MEMLQIKTPKIKNWSHQMLAKKRICWPNMEIENPELSHTAFGI